VGNSNKKTAQLNINDNNYYLYIHFYNYLHDFKLNKNLYIFTLYTTKKDNSLK